MQLNSFVLRLALLLLPGLLGSKVYRKLRGKTEKETWEDFAEILLFSILSYLLYFGLTLGVHRLIRAPALSDPPSRQQATTSRSTFDTLVDEKAPIDEASIVGASFVAVLLGFAASTLATREWMNRLGYLLGATRRQGDNNTWTLFNLRYAPPGEYQWANVRDSKANLVYFGQIRHFSDPGSLHELVMHDVTVFENDTGERRYDVSVLYVARDAGDLSIEFPAPAANNQSSTKLGAPDGGSTNDDDDDAGLASLRAREGQLQPARDPAEAKFSSARTASKPEA